MSSCIRRIFYNKGFNKAKEGVYVQEISKFLLVGFLFIIDDLGNMTKNNAQKKEKL
jgi:hypothetical protein